MSTSKPSPQVLQQLQTDAATAHAAAIAHAFQKSREEGAQEVMKLVQSVRQVATLQAHDALRFIREWFLKLEDGAPDDEALNSLRRKYHAPVHAEIDKVLGPR